MSESKGGHAHKGDEVARPMKVLVEFEDKTFDIWDIKRIEKDIETDYTRMNGVSYLLRIRLSSYPSEVVYKFETAEIRDSKYTKLKGKLLLHGVVVM